MEKSIGSIVLDENGNVILLTEIGVITETYPGSGQIATHDAGVVLGGTAPLCTRGTIKSADAVRIVGHIREVVRHWEQTGVDLTAQPEKPLSQLNPLERIERLERAAAAKWKDADPDIPILKQAKPSTRNCSDPLQNRSRNSVSAR